MAGLKIKIFVYAVLASFFFLLIGFAGAEESAVRIIYIKGSPNVLKAGKADWEACRLQMAVDNGDRIKTLKGEIADISFLKDNSNIVRIEENSDVFIKRGQSPYLVELLNGSTMARIQNLPQNSTFEIRTPTGISGARGTGWGGSTNGESSLFRAFVNFIYVKGIDSSGKEMKEEALLKSGWKMRVNKFGAPEGLEKLSRSDIDRWDAWMKDLLENKYYNINSADKLENRLDNLESRKDAVNESRDDSRLGKREGPGKAEDDRY